jgi:hypothetical protein
MVVMREKNFFDEWDEKEWIRKWFKTLRLLNNLFNLILWTFWTISLFYTLWFFCLNRNKHVLDYFLFYTSMYLNVFFVAFFENYLYFYEEARLEEERRVRITGIFARLAEERRIEAEENAIQKAWDERQEAEYPIWVAHSFEFAQRLQEFQEIEELMETEELELYETIEVLELVERARWLEEIAPFKEQEFRKQASKERQLEEQEFEDRELALRQLQEQELGESKRIPVVEFLFGLHVLELI